MDIQVNNYKVEALDTATGEMRLKKWKHVGEFEIIG